MFKSVAYTMLQAKIKHENLQTAIFAKTHNRCKLFRMQCKYKMKNINNDRLVTTLMVFPPPKQS